MREIVSRQQHIRWLEKELPSLVEQGILTEQAADGMRGYYGEREEQVGRRWAIVLFSIIGAVLIGGGVILLLAHNWDSLSRAARAALSFAPMVAGQIAAAWVLSRKQAGTGAREGAAAFLSLAVGACIALISQTYHLSDDFGAFVLTWMLLVVPLVYVMDALVPALIYLVGITSWVTNQQIEGGHTVWFWVLAAALLPFGRGAVMENRYGVRTVILLWFTALCLCIATGVSLERILPGLWIVVYAGLLSFFFLAGGYWFDESTTFWKRPLLVVGAVGTAILSLMLSNEWPWHEIGWCYYRCGSQYQGLAAIPDYFLAVLLPVASISLLVTAVRRGQTGRMLFGAFPIVAVFGYVVVSIWDLELMAGALFSLYLLALSMETLVRGFRERRTAYVNYGMLMFSALIVNRFFSSEFSIVGRGIVFILLGIGFFATNIFLARRKEAAS